MAVLALASNVSAENMFNKLLNIKQHDYAKTNPGINRMDLGGSGLFFYKLNRSNRVDKTKTTSQSHPEIDMSDYDLEAIKQALEEQKSKNTDPIEPVISKNKETEEQGYKATQAEKEIVYGEGSSLQNRDVLTAWDNHDRKKRELDDLREEMERIRQARKVKEHSKQVDIEK